MMKKVADKSVNELYGGIRSKYGDARANGYRLHKYFLREQEIVLSEFKDINANYILDIGCGSGLMTQPLINKARLLIGLDFNEDACNFAKSNQLNVIRGNAFSMPLATNSIHSACCCQFLNQQSNENMKSLVKESYRILAKGGKIIIIWRNGEALIHRLAHILFKLYDLITNQPTFPVINHSIDDVESFAHSVGFKTAQKQTIFPLIRWRTTKTNSILSRLIGTSNFLVLEHK